MGMLMGMLRGVVVRVEAVGCGVLGIKGGHWVAHHVIVVLRWGLVYWEVLGIGFELGMIWTEGVMSLASVCWALVGVK